MGHADCRARIGSGQSGARQMMKKHSRAAVLLPLKFVPAGSRIRARMYSQVLNKYEPDADSSFTLPYSIVTERSAR